jgi:hypothetical protein
MKFTPEEINIAVKVLSRSKHIDQWVRGEMRAFGLSIDTPAGKKFYDTQRIEAARRLIK